jgi:hypothetical protein
MSAQPTRINRLWRTLLLLAGVLFVAMAALLPVDALVNKAISPAVRQQILERGTPERITFLETQFSTSLMWFRSLAGVLGSWLLLLGALFPFLMKWDTSRPTISIPAFGSAASASSCSNPSPPSTPHRPLSTLYLPFLWSLLTILLSIPIITKGFEHEELLIMDMLAKRGVLVSAACQNQPPRAAQPAYTIVESFVVRAFGDSEAAARAPSVVLGALVMIPLFLIALRLGGLGLANLACALTATNAFFLFYINYARGYAFAMTMYLSAILIGLLILERSTWRRWFAMGACILIGVYAHMAMGVYIAFVCLVLLFTLLFRRLISSRSSRSVSSASSCSTLAEPNSTLHPPLSTLHLLVRPVMVWGTVVLTLAWLYSIGVPASLVYLSKFDLTSYYMAYHINVRFLETMLTLLAGLRMLPFWNWVVLATGLAGIVLLFRKAWVVASHLVAPLFCAIVLFYVKNLFVYPRYFIFFIPILCLFFALPLASFLNWLSRRASAPSASSCSKSLPSTVHSPLSTVYRLLPTLVVWVVVIGVATANLQRLYAMERCGVKTAIKDAKEAMAEGDRIAGVLDGKVTVEHYYPGSISMFKDTDFWRELNSPNPPEWVINVPYIEYDIPGGWDALKEKYDLYRDYPSWMDVDDDQDSVYLYRRKDLKNLNRRKQR